MKFLKLISVTGVLAATLSTAVFATDLKLKEATITLDGAVTRFELPLSQQIGFGATSDQGSNRITLNLPEFNADVAPGTSIPGQGEISSYSFEMDAQGNSLIVLNMQKPTDIKWSTVVAAKDGKPARIQIDLIAKSQQIEDQSLATSSLTPAPALPISPVTAAASSAPLEPQPKHVVVIDPGHGGIDPGAVSQSGTKEKDVVLAYARTLMQSLENTGRYEVVLTRSSDSFVKLDDRVKLARDHNAELFIAVHADMIQNHTVRGTTVYTVSDKASDFEAEALAQKENGVDKVAGLNLSKQKQNVADALMNLAQRESKSEAVLFAQKAVQEMKPVTELPTNPLRSANFVVLKAPDVPSVLVELGYLSNIADEGLLTSVQWRKEMATAMTKAVDAHFNILTASAGP